MAVLWTNSRGVLGGDGAGLLLGKNKEKQNRKHHWAVFMKSMHMGLLVLSNK